MGRGVVEGQWIVSNAVRTNLQILKRSREAPQRGDIFALKPSDDRYLFGRVILADVPQTLAPMPGANLLYLYRHRSSDTSPDLSELRPDRLLIAPVWTNRLAWTKGYFQTLRNEPVQDADLLQQHCFFFPPLLPGATGKFVDQRGNELSRRVEPCGEWGLVSYRWIDDRVSDALGIPRVPLDGD